jgi:hypothetical protein
MTPTLPDRLLWTLILGVSAAAATVLARRGAEWAWRRVRGDEPPTTIGLLEALAHRVSEPAFDWRH